MRHRLSGILIGWLLVGAASPARAAVERGAIVLPPTVRLATTQQRAAHEQGPEWRGFQARHGRWTAEWNEVTGTPHRAIGPPIALSGFAPDGDRVDRAVRAWIAGEATVFGAGLDLETVAVQKVRNVWYARYRQRVRGIPVA